MKKANLLLIILAVFFASSSFTSCKNKATDNSSADSSAITPTSVVISGDEELKIGVLDATKDYPSVKADVTDSVIILTGEIARADWQKLNPTLNSLHPKRVNSDNLTIK